MDCPCLLGRTLFSLTVLSQKSSLCCQMVPAVSVCHPGCPFACFHSPAAFYLFVSAHICSRTSPLKLCCFAPKTAHSTLLARTAPPHLIYLSDQNVVHLRPKQEVLLVLLFLACAMYERRREFCVDEFTSASFTCQNTAR